MRDLNELFVFTTVAERNGFSAAARVLKIPKSSVSRYVGRLESRLGARLLERSTRSVRLTEAGRAFHDQCRVTLAELDAAEARVAGQSAAPSGVVRVSCPTGISQTTLARAVPTFMRKYPSVRVHIRVTNRPVNLVEDRVDVAIRARCRLKDEAVTMRKLRTSRLIFVASPAFAQVNSIPRDPTALIQLPMLSFQEDEERPRWRLIGPKQTVRHVSFQPVLWSSDLSILSEAACAGVGIALLPIELAEAFLQNSRLTHLLPDWRSEDVTIHLVFRAGSVLPAAVRAFVDHLAGETERT